MSQAKFQQNERRTPSIAVISKRCERVGLGGLGIQAAQSRRGEIAQQRIVFLDLSWFEDLGILARASSPLSRRSPLGLRARARARITRFRVSSQSSHDGTVRTRLVHTSLLICCVVIVTHSQVAAGSCGLFGVELIVISGRHRIQTDGRSIITSAPARRRINPRSSAPQQPSQNESSGSEHSVTGGRVSIAQTPAPLRQPWDDL